MQLLALPGRRENWFTISLELMDIHQLYTTARLAEQFHKAPHTIAHHVRKLRLEPVAWIGNTRLFTSAQAEQVGGSLTTLPGRPKKSGVITAPH